MRCNQCRVNTNMLAVTVSEIYCIIMFAVVAFTSQHMLNYNVIWIYTVFQKKEATKLLAMTFSNLNRFSKFFHCWKEDEIANKIT